MRQFSGPAGAQEIAEPMFVKKHDMTAREDTK